MSIAFGFDDPHDESAMPRNFLFVDRDEDANVDYQPWTDGWAVGFRCERDGQVEYIYLNPSGGSDDGVPTIFLYQGSEGDPAQDPPACDHHYRIFRETREDA